MCGQRHAPSALPPGNDLSGLRGWSGRVRKITLPTEIRSPYRPAHSESLCQLIYPSPRLNTCEIVTLELFSRDVPGCGLDSWQGHRFFLLLVVDIHPVLTLKVRGILPLFQPYVLLSCFLCKGTFYILRLYGSKIQLSPHGRTRMGCL